MIQSAHFDEFNFHLLNDERPSLYFESIFDEPFFRHPPFDMLRRLKETEQSPQYHPEGDVWVHTMLVLDCAAKMRKKSRNAAALMWAALLHDIGKPATTKKTGGKITAYGHDSIGAELAARFLSALTEDARLISDVKALVRWHMQILYVVSDGSFDEVAAMSSDTDVEEIALLGLCDRLGRKNIDTRAEKENIRIFLQKLKDNKDEEN